jgi:hypothetical protein
MLILFGVDLNLGLPICGRCPIFPIGSMTVNLGRTLFSTEKELAIDVSLYTFLQILSVHSFEKIPILQAFSDGDHRPAAILLPNQLNLLNT